MTKSVDGRPTDFQTSPPTKTKSNKTKNMKLASTIAATLAVLALASTAHAQKINGTIGFTGSATLNSSNLNSATTVMTWSGTTAAQPITGNFASAGIVAGTPVTFTPNWVFVTGLNSLWTVGPFTFNYSSGASTVTTFNGQTFLGVSGTGIIKGTGFTDTPGTFSFTAQTPGVASVFTFSASGTAVPDGGASVALLGLSLIGLGGASRLVRRK